MSESCAARLRALKDDQRLADGYGLAFPNAHFGDDAPFKMLDGFLAAVGVDHARRHGASIKRCKIAPTAKHNHKH
jgi:hypothetical protein